MALDPVDLDDDVTKIINNRFIDNGAVAAAYVTERQRTQLAALNRNRDEIWRAY